MVRERKVQVQKRKQQIKVLRKKEQLFDMISERVKEMLKREENKNSSK